MYRYEPSPKTVTGAKPPKLIHTIIFVVKDNYPMDNCYKGPKVSMIPFVILIFFLMSNKLKRKAVKSRTTGYSPGFSGFKNELWTFLC